MPLVEITMAEGRPPEAIRTLLAKVHTAVQESIGAPDASIRVLVREIPPTHWQSGGVTLAERDVQRDAQQDAQGNSHG
ncbi:4-oxalocrotonate tautomerase family protein [Streptomyces sp. NPDC058247]|uniref:tautomerase family protein n=1 Tax=Streptomyces sp. NPDC058247 TaxID=3346401 RepID=UPI0036EEDD13